MKFGIGGGIGPFRAGVSNKGFGVGAGPLSAGDSWKAGKRSGRLPGGQPRGSDAQPLVLFPALEDFGDRQLAKVRHARAVRKNRPILVNAIRMAGEMLAQLDDNERAWDEWDTQPTAGEVLTVLPDVGVWSILPGAGDVPDMGAGEVWVTRESVALHGPERTWSWPAGHPRFYRMGGVVQILPPETRKPFYIGDPETPVVGGVLHAAMARAVGNAELSRATLQAVRSEVLADRAEWQAALTQMGQES